MTLVLKQGRTPDVTTVCKKMPCTSAVVVYTHTFASDFMFNVKPMPRMSTIFIYHVLDRDDYKYQREDVVLYMFQLIILL